MFGGTIFSLSSNYFSGKYLLSRRRCATTIAVGFYFAAALTSNAQDQLHHHVRTENDDFRDGGELGVVAGNIAALSLYSLSRTRPEPEHCRDGGDTFRHSDFLDFRANHRSRAP